MHPVLVAIVVDRQDVRMLKGGDGACLLRAALLPVIAATGAAALAQQPDGDGPAKLSLLGYVDVAHAATADAPEDVVPAECCAVQPRHATNPLLLPPDGRALGQCSAGLLARQSAHQPSASTVWTSAVRWLRRTR